MSITPDTLHLPVAPQRAYLPAALPSSITTTTVLPPVALSMYVLTCSSLHEHLFDSYWCRYPHCSTGTLVQYCMGVALTQSGTDNNFKPLALHQHGFSIGTGLIPMPNIPYTNKESYLVQEPVQVTTASHRPTCPVVLHSQFSTLCLSQNLRQVKNY